MKYAGCQSDFVPQRNKELMTAFLTAINDLSFININEVADKVVNSPCSRFWVSEERATVVVSAILAGKPILDTMRPQKKDMFTEIYNRVLPLRDKEPDANLCDLVFLAVNSQAPKFYMQPSYAVKIIYQIINKNSRQQHNIR